MVALARHLASVGVTMAKRRCGARSCLCMPSIMMMGTLFNYVCVEECLGGEYCCREGRCSPTLAGDVAASVKSGQGC